MKNQEGQTPLDLATAEDVRALLLDAMPHGTLSQTAANATAATVPMSRPFMTTSRPVTSGVAAPVPDAVTTAAPQSSNTAGTVSASNTVATVTPIPPTPAPAAVVPSTAGPVVPKVAPPPGVPPTGDVTGGSQTGDGAADVGGVDKQSPELLMVTHPMDISVGAFLRSIQLDHLRDVFDKEQVRFLLRSCVASRNWDLMVGN